MVLHLTGWFTTNDTVFFLYIKLCYLIASYITKHYTLWQQYADNWICNCYIRWFSIFSQTAQWWRHDPLYSEDDLRPTSGILLCFPSPSYSWLPLPDFKDMYVKWKATSMTLSDASCSVLCSTVQALLRAYCVYGENVRTLTTYQFMFSIHTFNSTFTQFQAQYMGEGATGWFQTWHKELKKRSHQRIIGSHENLYFRFICSAT